MEHLGLGSACRDLKAASTSVPSHVVTVSPVHCPEWQFSLLHHNPYLRERKYERIKASKEQKPSLLLGVNVGESWGLPISWMTSVYSLRLHPAPVADMTNLSQHIRHHSAFLVATSSYSGSVRKMPSLTIPDLLNLLFFTRGGTVAQRHSETQPHPHGVSMTKLGTQVRLQQLSLEFTFPTTSVPIVSSVTLIWL